MAQSRKPVSTHAKTVFFFTRSANSGHWRKVARHRRKLARRRLQSQTAKRSLRIRSHLRKVIHFERGKTRNDRKLLCFVIEIANGHIIVRSIFKIRLCYETEMAG